MPKCFVLPKFKIPNPYFSYRDATHQSAFSNMMVFIEQLEKKKTPKHMTDGDGMKPSHILNGVFSTYFHTIVANMYMNIGFRTNVFV